MIIFRSELIWMKYVKWVWEKNVPSHRNFVYSGKIKVRKPSLMLTLSDVRKMIPHEIHPQLSISDMRMLLLTGEIGKAHYSKFTTFFFYTIDKISVNFCNLVRPKLACAEEALLYSLLHGWASWSYLARSRLPVVSRKKIFPKAI